MKRGIDRKYIPVACTICVAALLYVAAGLSYNGFFEPQVFINFLIDNAFLGIVAMGMTFVILSGGIDLSVGSVVALTGVLTAFLVEKSQWHPLAVFPVALLCGSLLGFGMGCIIHFFKSPPFIVTLAGMIFARGMANVISLESIPIYHPFFANMTSWGIPLGNGMILPSIVLIYLGVFGCALYLAHYTKFGRNVYAIGGSEQSAQLMGVAVGRTKIAIYALSGFLSALGGIVLTMYTSAGYGLAGEGLELDAIACVVIGGTLLSGGVGYLAGTFVGVLIMGIIQTFIIFKGTLSSWWTKIAIGILLFIFIVLQRALLHFSQRSKRTVVSAGSKKKSGERPEAIYKAE